MNAVAQDLFPPDSRSAAFDENESRKAALGYFERSFAHMSAENRVRWSLDRLPGNHVLSSSFGAQAAVSLHLLTQVAPGMPVILVDTGYLFPETYRYIDQLSERLNLNLKVYRSELSPAWQEARFGRRWEQGLAGIEAYNHANKVEPMRRALRELQAGTWFAGLRRRQSHSRGNIPFLEMAGSRWKVHPIADWTDRDVSRYLGQHNLPRHPLWAKGYVSIGDTHSTRPIQEVSHADETRFHGLKRECGLHEFDLSAA